MRRLETIIKRVAPPWVREKTAPSRSLGAVGEQAETVRLSMASMAARLDELKSLSGDFSRMMGPLDDFLERHPQLQARLSEVEAGLARELDVGAELRRERDEAAAAALKAADEAAQSAAALARQQTHLRESEDAIARLRASIRSRTEAVEALQRKNDQEAERSRSLSDECESLRAHAQAQGQALAQVEQRLAEVQAHAAMLDRDNERLTRATEEQARRIGDLMSRRDELERLLGDVSKRCSQLEAGIVDEIGRRQRAEAQSEAERNSASIEIAALTLKSESLGARIAASMQTLSQTREQLRDKVERVQSAEQAATSAALESAASARKAAAAQEEARRALDALAEIRSANGALGAQVEMLESALVGKTADLESAHAKIQALADRVEQLKANGAEERAALEAANRRLENALQGERAERSLAQGALTIARESRARLQSEFANLKRRAEQEPTTPAETSLNPAATPQPPALSAAAEAKRRKAAMTEAAQ